MLEILKPVFNPVVKLLYTHFVHNSQGVEECRVGFLLPNGLPNGAYPLQVDSDQ